MIKCSSISKLNLITIMISRFILFSFLFLTFSSFGNDKRLINNYEWTYRLLLINFIEKTTSLDQLLENKNILCQFEDRKLKIIKFKNNESSTYITPSYIKNKFGVWLIGYDGSVKYFTSIEEFNFDDIFTIIDGMPMRQNEMEMNKSDC